MLSVNSINRTMWNILIQLKSKSWKSLRSRLPMWWSCCSKLGARVRPPPARCDTKYILMPPLSRVPCTYGGLLPWSILQLRICCENQGPTGVCYVVQSSPRFVLTSREEAELAGLTSYLSPPRARFSTGDLVRVIVFGDDLPRVQEPRDTPSIK